MAIIKIKGYKNHIKKNNHIYIIILYCLIYFHKGKFWNLPFFTQFIL